jgi:hypothetical protein
MYKPPQQAFSPHISRGYTAQQNSQPVDYELTIKPARLIDKSGNEKEYYPSYQEELVEEALKKIAADRLNGVFLNKAPCGRTFQPQPRYQGPACWAVTAYVPRLITSPSS